MKGFLQEHWRHRPSEKTGHVLESYFSLKLVGAIDIVCRTLNWLEYFTWGMKEPNYVVKIMGIGDTLVTERCKEAHWKWVDGNKRHMAKIHNSNPFHWHFHYCHIVDYHNNLTHALPSIEDTWRTSWWSARVFAFLFSVSAINIYLALQLFV